MSVVNNPFYGSSQGKPQDRSGDRVNFVPTCFGCEKKDHKHSDSQQKQKVGCVNNSGDHNSGDESEVARREKPSEGSESVKCSHQTTRSICRGQGGPVSMQYTHRYGSRQDRS